MTKPVVSEGLKTFPVLNGGCVTVNDKACFSSVGLCGYQETIVGLEVSSSKFTDCYFECYPVRYKALVDSGAGFV